MHARTALPVALLLLLTGCSYVYEVDFAVTVAGAEQGDLVMEIRGQETDRRVVPLVAGQSTYTQTLGTCCSPEPAVTLHAWLDLNGNQTHDPGEPQVQDARGEMVLKDKVQTQLALTVAPTPPTTPPPLGTPPRSGAGRSPESPAR